MSCLVQPLRRSGDWYDGRGLAALFRRHHFIVLTGLTGSGKTDLLRRMILRGAQALDLEALAGHCGSAFGGLGSGPQPSPADFLRRVESHLRVADARQPVWVEGKGQRLGRLALPSPLLERMARADVVHLRCEERLRLAHLVGSYGCLPRPRLLRALDRLRNRLSPDELRDARRLLTRNDVEGAIRIVLRYYDAAYATPAPERIMTSIDVAPDALEESAERLLQMPSARNFPELEERPGCLLVEQPGRVRGQ